jgi:hypothetical protein
MLNTTTADPRRAEPGIDVHVEPRHLNVSAPGDFARGQRTNHAHVSVRGDFAIGMRTSRRPAAVGEFATGMRSSHGLRVTGDFATGMRSVPARVSLSHDTAVDRRSLPIAA